MFDRSDDERSSTITPLRCTSSTAGLQPGCECECQRGWGATSTISHPNTGVGGLLIGRVQSGSGATLGRMLGGRSPSGCLTLRSSWWSAPNRGSPRDASEISMTSLDVHPSSILACALDLAPARFVYNCIYALKNVHFSSYRKFGMQQRLHPLCRVSPPLEVASRIRCHLAVQAVSMIGTHPSTQLNSLC
jgi:hypothetical protein